jgi:dihydroxyacid dehydratase/phosphogluconate dehydratase
VNESSRESAPPNGGASGRGLTSYGDAGFSGFIRMAFARHTGLGPEDYEKPVIGICDTTSEINRCHAHFGRIVEALKRGVLMQGGVPFTFPTISLGEPFTSPTTMLYRNLAAMDTEEMIRAQPMDGVLLLGGCDKTVPAQLMGAASADVPALQFTGGPMNNGEYEGRSGRARTAAGTGRSTGRARSGRKSWSGSTRHSRPPPVTAWSWAARALWP